MFALEVEYLLGRAYAARFGDATRPEWPPHPGRLFAALAAAYFESAGNWAGLRALEWLESQPPPCIRAGKPGEPINVMAYVPTNYPGDGPSAVRGKQPRHFPAQAPSEPTVFFIWPDSDPPPEIASALDHLASRTGCLGRSCSFVQVRMVERAPEPNWIPDPNGETVLRVPGPGRLHELKNLFEADRRPSAGAQQLYTNLDAREGTQEPVNSEFGTMAVFRQTDGPGLPIEATLTLTEAIRSALLSVGGQDGTVSTLLHGHAGSHCALAALPFVDHQHADGHLLGFAIVIPRAVSASERRSVLAACSRLAVIRITGIGAWHVEAVESTTLNRGLRTATWVRPSRRWRTVTPILLDRYPKKGGPTVEGVLTAACRRIGLPDPVAIRSGPYPLLGGVPAVAGFRLQRRKEDARRWGVHAELTFATPVRGPVLLGAGRYFGLGLLRPVVEGGDEDF